MKLLTEKESSLWCIISHKFQVCFYISHNPETPESLQFKTEQDPDSLKAKKKILKHPQQVLLSAAWGSLLKNTHGKLPSSGKSCFSNDKQT